MALWHRYLNGQVMAEYSYFQGTESDDLHMHWVPGKVGFGAFIASFNQG